MRAHSRTALDHPLPDHEAWVHIPLRRAELLSVRFSQDIITRSLSGTHWVSWEGRDLFLQQGQTLRLSAGMALIDGAGVMQIAPVRPPDGSLRRLGKWFVAPFLASRAQALRIDIN